MRDRPKCEACDFYDEPKGSVSMMGRCQRFPRQETKNRASFCGEFEPRPDPEEEPEPDPIDYAAEQAALRAETNADEAEGET